jgi:hypothetical protein
MWCDRSHIPRVPPPDIERNSSAETPTTKHSTQRTESRPLPLCFKVMCQNIRGLHTRLEDVIQILQENEPDVLVLTETKLTRRGRNRIS